MFRELKYFAIQERKDRKKNLRRYTHVIGLLSDGPRPILIMIFQKQHKHTAVSDCACSNSEIRGKYEALAF